MDIINKTIKITDVKQLQKFSEGTVVLIDNKLCEIRQCKSCPKKFPRNIKRKGGKIRSHFTEIRKKGSVNCSMKCAKKYRKFLHKEISRNRGRK